MSRSLLAFSACLVLGASSVHSDDLVLPPPDDVKATATLTVDASDPDAVTARVRVAFQGYYRVREQLPVQRDAAGRFLLQARVEPVAVIQIFPPPPFPVADLTYRLGAVPRGSHVAVFKMNGKTFAEKAFTVGDPPPRIEALVTARVESAATGSVAHVRIELPDPYFEMSEPGQPVRDGQAIRINATLVPINTLVAIPAPKIIEHDYALGALPRGEYKLVYKINGDTKLEMPFRVGPLPAEGLVAVGAKAHEGKWFGLIELLLMPDVAVMPPEVKRDGNHFHVDVELTQLGRPISPNDAPRPVRVEALLGALAPGDYVFSASLGEATKRIEFRVTDGPPPPGDVRLAFIEIKPGPVSTVASVGLILPPGKAVTDWGEVRADGATFRAVVTVGDAPPTATDPAVGDPTPIIAPLPIVRHLYSLGLVAPGEYKFELLEGTRVLGSKPFRVEPKPPPPPPPRPVVAFIQPGHEDARWFVDVGLAFSRPALEVKDWGTAVPDGNTFKVDILIGEATPPPGPTDPAAGGTPVFLGPPIAVNDLVGPVPPAEVDRFNEIGDWPVHLVRHRYPLGALEVGEYVFVVSLAGEPTARKAFEVPAVQTPGPSITVRAETIARKLDAPQPFSVLYEAAAGFKTDPTAGPVLVRGPHGFEGKAILKGSVPSLDPIGRFILCSYEVEGPGGDWDAADNGEYSVCVDPTFVVDRNDRALARPCVFGWRVRIQPEPPPHLEAEVAVSMKDGTWQADVSFDNTGGWFTAAWGDPHMHGPVFLARAELRVPPAGSLVPIPARLEHTYLLGELRPGRYLFVFKSSAGHCGTAVFEVPGVEPPTPLAQWKLNVLGDNVGDDAADDDHDGLPVFAEFYLGCRPDRSDLPTITPALVPGADGEPRLALDFRRVSAGDDSVRCVVEVSADMTHWQEAGEDVELLPGPPDIDGTQPVRAAQKLATGQSRWPFMRLRLEQAVAP